MTWLNPGDQRRTVEAELQGPECRRLFKEFRREQTVPEAAEDWTAVLAFLRERGPDHPDTDAALRPLFARVAASAPDGAAAEAVLLASFWPMLEAIFHEKMSWEHDAEARWSEVLWAFLRATRRFNPARRPNRITGKIYNDTVHDLYRACRRRWEAAKREVPHDPTATEEMSNRVAFHASGEDEVSPATQAKNRLERFVAAGAIGDVDRLLLTRLYIEKLPLKEAAAKVGLSYEAAKKRRQRAEAAILRELEK